MVSKSDVDFNLFGNVAVGIRLHVPDDQKDNEGHNENGQQLDPQRQAPSGLCRRTERKNRSTL